MEMSSRKGTVQQKTFSIEWRIERFYADCKEPGDYYRSDVLPIKHASIKTDWYLEIFPLGEGEEDKNYVSLFLFYESDIESEIVVDFQLSVVSKIKSLSINKKAKIFKGKKDNWGYQFVEQSFIKDAKSGALINDTLTVLCKITFHSKGPGASRRFHGYDTWFDKIAKEYYENADIFGTASDVIFLVRNKPIYLHKAILMGRNSVFRAMFEHDMKEKNQSSVDITDVDYEIMKELFRFIYFGKVENIEKIAKELLVAADKYSIVELKALCEQTLYDNLTVDNAIDHLKLTDMCDTLHLKKLVIKFVVDNVKDILQKCDFKILFAELSPEVVREIMEAVAEKV